MQFRALIRRILILSIMMVPSVIAAAPSGLTNPLHRVGVNNLQQFIVKVAEAAQKLGVPFLIFAFVSSGFVLVVMRGGKPEERKEWIIRLGWLAGAGLVLLAAPMLADILYNTCVQLGACS